MDQKSILSTRSITQKESRMIDLNEYMKKAEPVKDSVLKKILDKAVEDTILDEQVQRILEPIIRMIYEGRFEKPRSRRLGKLIKLFYSLFISTITVVILIVLLSGGI